MYLCIMLDKIELCLAKNKHYLRMPSYKLAKKFACGEKSIDKMKARIYRTQKINKYLASKSNILN